jgi:hypothetical protein
MGRAAVLDDPGNDPAEALALALKGRTGVERETSGMAALLVVEENGFSEILVFDPTSETFRLTGINACFTFPPHFLHLIRWRVLAISAIHSIRVAATPKYHSSPTLRRGVSKITQQNAVLKGRWC